MKKLLLVLILLINYTTCIFGDTLDGLEWAEESNNSSDWDNWGKEPKEKGTIQTFNFSGKKQTNYKIIIDINEMNKNNESWDILNGKPDIKIISDIKSFRKVYTNKYRVKKNVSIVEKNELYFEIYDEDISSDELIGKGYCNIKKECTLGLATIRFIEYKE